MLLTYDEHERGSCQHTSVRVEAKHKDSQLQLSNKCSAMPNGKVSTQGSSNTTQCIIISIMLVLRVKHFICQNSSLFRIVPTSVMISDNNCSIWGESLQCIQIGRGFFGYSHQHKEGLSSIKDTDLSLFVVCKEFYFCMRILHVLYLKNYFYKLMLIPFQVSQIRIIHFTRFCAFGFLHSLF